MRPPRVSVITFTSYICCIYALEFGQYRTSFCSANSSVPKRLIYSFCSSDRGFASDFLQIPPHDGHPCLRLTVPTAKPVADFHRQVITHAGRTNKNSSQKINLMRRVIYPRYHSNFGNKFRHFPSSNKPFAFTQHYGRSLLGECLLVLRLRRDGSLEIFAIASHHTATL